MLPLLLTAAFFHLDFCDTILSHYKTIKDYELVSTPT